MPASFGRVRDVSKPVRRPLALLVSTSVMRWIAPRSSSFSTAAISRAMRSSAASKSCVGVRLLRMALGTKQVSRHFGNRNQISGIDLGFVFLRATAPHCSLNARLTLQCVHGALDNIFVRQLAHTNALRLTGWHAQCHLVLLECDNEKFKRDTSNLLLFNA